MEPFMFEHHKVKSGWFISRKSAEEALSYFVRKFEVLAAEVALLAARIKSGAMVPSDAMQLLRKLRDQVKELNGVGDLDALSSIC